MKDYTAYIPKEAQEFAKGKSYMEFVNECTNPSWFLHIAVNSGNEGLKKAVFTTLSKKLQLYFANTCSLQSKQLLELINSFFEDEDTKINKFIRKIYPGVVEVFTNFHFSERTYQSKNVELAIDCLARLLVKDPDKLYFSTTWLTFAFYEYHEKKVFSAKNLDHQNELLDPYRKEICNLIKPSFNI